MGIRKLLTIPNIIILSALPIITLIVYLSSLHALSGELVAYNSALTQEYLKQEYSALLWAFGPFFVVIYWLAFGGIVYGVVFSKKHILYLVNSIAAGWPIIWSIFVILLKFFSSSITGKEEDIILLIALCGIIIGLISLVALLGRKYRNEIIRYVIFVIFTISLNILWILLGWMYFRECFYIFGD